MAMARVSAARLAAGSLALLCWLPAATGLPRGVSRPCRETPVAGAVPPRTECIAESEDEAAFPIREFLSEESPQWEVTLNKLVGPGPVARAG